ncbi:MAG: acyl-CoA thioesterase [Fibrobacterota bacterium]|nr:acyl-CoA thioesterase [Fibrobacterota bacterium]
MTGPTASSNLSTTGNQSEINIQVRYSETDAMKFVYYANYLVYFEVARTSALAELGHPYWEMEKRNVLIPVLTSHCEYLKPGRYGDQLTIRTLRWRHGLARIHFEYEVRRGEELLARGYTEHAFMHPEGRAIKPPREIVALFPFRPPFRPPLFPARLPD